MSKLIKKTVLAFCFLFACENSYSENKYQEAHKKGIKLEVWYKNGGYATGSATAFKGTSKKGEDVAFLLTCLHVLTDSDGIRLHFPAAVRIKTPKGSVMDSFSIIEQSAINTSFDFAVVVVTNNLQIFDFAEPIGPKESIVIGDKVVCVGHTGGYPTIVTEGIISAKDFKLPDSERVFDVISNSVAGGFSGGGVFRQSDGKYIGLISRRYSQSGYGMIVPIRQIYIFLEFLEKDFIINKDKPFTAIKSLLK